MRKHVNATTAPAPSFFIFLPPSLPSFLPSSLPPFVPSFLPSFPFLPPFLLLDLPRGVSLRNFRRRGSEAKVRSGLKRVSANTGFASAISTFARNWSSTAIPLMVFKRFRSTWLGGRRADTPLYERQQTPQPPPINSNNTKNKIIGYRKIYDPETTIARNT